jgi:fibronectin type 3 domain-containing protein
VILSWRASAPADSKHADAVGYCIYRGNQRNDPQPVLINSSPFPATSCMDDMVESGKKYYYVVRAISAQSMISIISNSAPAAIPTRERTEADVPGKSAPLCREPVRGK